MIKKQTVFGLLTIVHLLQFAQSDFLTTAGLGFVTNAGYEGSKTNGAGGRDMGDEVNFAGAVDFNMGGIMGMAPSTANYPGAFPGYAGGPGYILGHGAQTQPQRRKLTRSVGTVQVREVHIPMSPCPTYFLYKRDYEGGELYGLVFYQKQPGLTQYVCEVHMAINRNVFHDDNIRLSLNSTSTQVLNGPLLVWKVKFPYQDMIPTLTALSFNEREVCSGEPEPFQEDELVQTKMWSRSTITTGKPTVIKMGHDESLRGAVRKARRKILIS